MILITGAAGFIGRRLARRLAAAGRTVRCLLRPGTPAPAGTCAVYGELLDAESLKRAAAGADIVYHAGALVRPRAMFAGRTALEKDYFRTNEEGTGKMAAAAAAAGAAVFLHLSSMAAMGPGRALREDSPCRPLTMYGRSKLASEKAALSAIPPGGRTRLVITRPAMIYGSDSPSWRRLFTAIRSGTAPLPGDGKQLLSVCWIESLLDALELLAERGADRAVYSISDGSLSAESLVRLSAAAMGLETGIFRIPAAPLKALSSFIDTVTAFFGASLPRFNYLAEPGALREALSDWEHDTSGLRSLGWKPRLSHELALAAELSGKDLAESRPPGYV